MSAPRNSLKTQSVTVRHVTFSKMMFAFLSTELRDGGADFSAIVLRQEYFIFLPMPVSAFSGHHKILVLTKSFLLFQDLILLPKCHNCLGEVTKLESLSSKFSVFDL